MASLGLIIKLNKYFNAKFSFDSLLAAQSAVIQAMQSWPVIQEGDAMVLLPPVLPNPCAAYSKLLLHDTTWDGCVNKLSTRLCCGGLRARHARPAPGHHSRWNMLYNQSGTITAGKSR